MCPQMCLKPTEASNWPKEETMKRAAVRAYGFGDTLDAPRGEYIPHHDCPCRGILAVLWLGEGEPDCMLCANRGRLRGAAEIDDEWMSSFCADAGETLGRVSYLGKESRKSLDVVPGVFCVREPWIEPFGDAIRLESFRELHDAGTTPTLSIEAIFERLFHEVSIT